MMCDCGSVSTNDWGTATGSTLKAPDGDAGPQLGLSREERLTLCSTILLHGEGPVPNLTAEEA